MAAHWCSLYSPFRFFFSPPIPRMRGRWSVIIRPMTLLLPWNGKEEKEDIRDRTFWKGCIRLFSTESCWPRWLGLTIRKQRNQEAGRSFLLSLSLSLDLVDFQQPSRSRSLRMKKGRERDCLNWCIMLLCSGRPRKRPRRDYSIGYTRATGAQSKLGGNEKRRRRRRREKLDEREL